jgi:pyruvate dehydrogenase kinase 2/3/4
MAQDLTKKEYGSDFPVPEIKLDGHLGATFPYILNHLEYMIEELLRNSIQAVTENFSHIPEHMPAIHVLVCEAPQHVIFRFSDQGGGIPRSVMPYIWSFSKGPRRLKNLENLLQVPRMAATMQELAFIESALLPQTKDLERDHGSLTSRPSNLKLGIGLPMCRVFAEYWAGSLELQSLEGYGTDVFLHIPKLGNKNEQLTTRAVMDQV